MYFVYSWLVVLRGHGIQQSIGKNEVNRQSECIITRTTTKVGNHLTICDVGSN